MIWSLFLIDSNTYAINEKRAADVNYLKFISGFT